MARSRPAWRGILPFDFEEITMRRLAALLALVLAASIPAMGPARAVDDALSVEANQAYLAANAKKKGVIVRPSGLQFKILKNGFGKRPIATDTVKVYYTGALINGTVFDGTSPGLPFQTKVNSVIPGWIEALQIMREGDHWQLVIPPNIGYGNRGMAAGGIPPDQTLVFDLTLISTTPAPKKGEPGYEPDPNDKDADDQK
jgi:FKBP-type peptidyl-prolyl cis-trans isomerase FklB